ncbi:MAG: hypothetical protein PHO66_04885 [Eubacteriales bacterium]|nr:hypothetical protein [Eubacteriales bacterium]
MRHLIWAMTLANLSAAAQGRQALCVTFLLVACLAMLTAARWLLTRWLKRLIRQQMKCRRADADDIN